MLHLKGVFTKRDRTARLFGVANFLFQHPNGLTAPHIAELIGMNVRTVYRDLRAIKSEEGVPIWQEGSLLMTLDVGGLLEITPWLLGWGAAVEVLDPPELRDTIRQVACEMANRYLPVPS